eukprot:jgi/Chlat1/3204/Chrsp22S08805
MGVHAAAAAVAAAAGTAAAGTAVTAETWSGGHRSLAAFIHNGPLLAAFLSFALAQFLKVFFTWLKERRWDLRRTIDSGGMPSSHSALVVGITGAVGWRNGMDDELFALCCVIAAVVMYDAAGVRLAAGRQAEVLNQIIYELPAEHPVSDTRPLREHLGHTGAEVAGGALVGILVSYFTWVATGRPTGTGIPTPP